MVVFYVRLFHTDERLDSDSLLSVTLGGIPGSSTPATFTVVFLGLSRDPWRKAVLVVGSADN